MRDQNNNNNNNKGRSQHLEHPNILKGVFYSHFGPYQSIQFAISTVWRTNFLSNILRNLRFFHNMKLLDFP